MLKLNSELRAQAREALRGKCEYAFTKGKMSFIAQDFEKLNIITVLEGRTQAIKRYWKLIQQDSRKLSDKRFYRPTFRMHLTNKEILDKILSYSEDLRHHYNLYQLLLFHFQNKEPEKFFGLIEDNLKQVHPLFQTVFKTFQIGRASCRERV